MLGKWMSSCGMVGALLGRYGVKILWYYGQKMTLKDKWDN